MPHSLIPLFFGLLLSQSYVVLQTGSIILGLPDDGETEKERE